MMTLIKLAEKHFVDRTLTTTEMTLLKNLPLGKEVVANLLDKDHSKNQNNYVYADLLRWLCINKTAREMVEPKGILLRNVIIKGNLDFEDMSVPFPIDIRNSILDEEIILRDAHLQNLVLYGCKIKSISADRLKVNGSIILSDSRIYKGISLYLARVEGDVYLENARVLNSKNIALALHMAKIEGSLYISNGCRVFGLLLMSNAIIRGNVFAEKGLFLRKNNHSIFAEDIQIGGSARLSNGFKTTGWVTLINGSINSHLDCSNSGYRSKKNWVIIANGIHVKGNVDLFGAYINGLLNFKSAIIEGDFILTNTQLIGARGFYALLATEIKIGGSLFLNDKKTATSRGFRCLGLLSLERSQIEGEVNLRNARLLNRGRDCLNLSQSVIGQSINAKQGFRSYGSVIITLSRVQGDVNFSGAFISNRGEDTLNLSSSNIKGILYCRNGFRSYGKVSIASSEIRGDVNFSAGYFENISKVTIFADGLVLKSIMLMDHGFKALGQVRMVNAVIEGSLECSGATFIHDGALKPGGEPEGEYLQYAFEASFLKVRSMVLLSSYPSVNIPFIVEGRLNFSGAEIGKDFYAQNIEFNSDYDNGINLSGATINQRFVWSPLKINQWTYLLLINTKVGQFDDSSDLFPKAANLNITGFTYDQIVSQKTEKDLNIEWLLNQRENTFNPQPYEQLAHVLHDSGLDTAANQIMVEKERHRRVYLTGFQKYWSQFLDISLRHGYASHRPLIIGLLFIIAGCFIFSWANEENLFVYKKKQEASVSFNSVMYSIDSFVPIINFHQQNARLPKSGRQCTLFEAKRDCGSLLSVYFWVHIVMGWVVSSLFVMSFTNLVRKH